MPTQIGYNHRTVTYSPFRCRSQERRFHHSSRANPSPTTPPSTRLHSDWWFWLRYGFTQLFVQGSNYSFKGNSHRADVCPLNPGVRRMKDSNYPDVRDPLLVGTYSPSAKAGGGYVWDDVLEYRVWCHPENGAPDLADGSDYYYAFATYQEALAFSQETAGAEEPLALIVQDEYIDEPAEGEFIHVREQRVAEWSVAFLSRPKRSPQTIPDFFAPDAPVNRLDILRGL